MKLSLLHRRLTPALNIPLLHTGGALIASSLASSGLGFMYWVVAAHMLSVREVGMGSAIISAVGLAATFSLCGLNFLSARFLPVAGNARLQFSRWIQVIATVLGCVGGIFFIFLSSLWASPLHSLGVLFVVAATISTMYAVQDHVLLGLGHAKWVPLNNGFYGVGKLVLLIIAVGIWKQDGWEAIVWPWLAMAVIDVAFVGILIERFAPLKPAIELAPRLPALGELTRFAIGNHIGALLLQLPPLIYPMLILHVLGEKPVAFFYTSWMLANLVMLSSSNIVSAMVAQAARSTDKVDELLLAGLRYAMVLTIPAAIALIALGKPLLFIFGSSYQGGYPLLLILALGLPIYAVNSFYAGLMRVRRHLTPVVVQGVCAGVLAIGLAYPLGAMLGLAGFGVAFVAGQCMAMLLILPRLVRLWRRFGRSSTY